MKKNFNKNGLRRKWQWQRQFVLEERKTCFWVDHLLAGIVMVYFTANFYECQWLSAECLWSYVTERNLMKKLKIWTFFFILCGISKGQATKTFQMKPCWYLVASFNRVKDMWIRKSGRLSWKGQKWRSFSLIAWVNFLCAAKLIVLESKDKNL